MRILFDADRSEVGNLVPLETSAVTIDADSSHLVMQVLSGLYNYLVMAVAREYLTNARDEHIEAGKADVPIDVYLPNDVLGDFVVVDHGRGLTVEEIKTTYSTYLRSPKRESDDLTGGFGLGSKSALAYGDAFTVTSVKDGMRTIAMIGPDETGAAKVRILLREVTSDPSGTEVRVPIADGGDRHRLSTAVHWLLGFWDTPANVDDEPVSPHREADDCTILADDTYVLADNTNPLGHHGGWVVMDAVPYRVPSLPAGAVVDVPSGYVRPAYNREALYDERRTEKFLKEVVKYFKGRSEHWLQKNHLTAWDRALLPNWARQSANFYANFTLKSGVWRSDRWVDPTEGAVVVTGFNLRRPTPRHAEVLRSLGYTKNVHIANNYPDGAPTIPFAVVKAEMKRQRDVERAARKATTPHKPKAVKPSEVLYDTSHGRFTAEDLATVGTVYMVPLTRDFDADMQRVAFLKGAHPDEVFARIYDRSVAKLERVGVDVQPLSALTQRLFDAGEFYVPRLEVRLTVLADGREIHTYDTKYSIARDIFSEEFNEYDEAVRRRSALNKLRENMMLLLRKHGVHSLAEEPLSISEEYVVEVSLKAYPLLKYTSGAPTQLLKDYVHLIDNCKGEN